MSLSRVISDSVEAVNKKREKMTEKCICGSKVTDIPKEFRFELFEPTFLTRREDGVVVKDMSKRHVFSTQCPQHGITWLDEDGQPISNEGSSDIAEA